MTKHRSFWSAFLLVAYTTSISNGFIVPSKRPNRIINSQTKQKQPIALRVSTATPPSSSSTSSAKTTSSSDETIENPVLHVLKQNLYAVPIVSSVVAFVTYGATTKCFHNLVTIASNNNWTPVDGGSYQATIISPAINGPVIASIAILYGTLVSTTISNLYQRQNELRSYTIQEAQNVRYLMQILDGFNDPKAKESVKSTSISTSIDYLMIV